MFKIDAGLAHVSLRESVLRRKRTVDGGAGEIKAREANFVVGVRSVSPDQKEIEGSSLALAGDL
jgi:hypothetical protein